MTGFTFTMHRNRGDEDYPETFETFEDARNCAWEQFNADITIHSVTFTNPAGEATSYDVVINTTTSAGFA